MAAPFVPALGDGNRGQHEARAMKTLTRAEEVAPNWFLGYFYGAPGEIRTPGLLIRSQSLYPAELRAHVIAGSWQNLTQTNRV